MTMHARLGYDHLRELSDAAAAFAHHVPRLTEWGDALATRLEGGGRLLVAGNGGSAAEAQHLTAEIVGRYRCDRRPYSAIALHVDTSAVTAIVNDYGPDEVFARQVEAHGRDGDLCVLLSTSGRSPNLLRAAGRARECGLTTWALTGSWPNPLAALCDDAVCVQAAGSATVQELHLVAVHILCGVFDDAVQVQHPGAPLAAYREQPRLSAVRG